MCGDYAWTPPEIISGAMANASDPQIAMDSQGNMAAAWIEDGVVYTSYRPFEGAWETAAALSASTASSPRLALDESGNATLVWERNGIIYTADRPAMGNWSGASALSGSGASNPALAVNSGGDAVAVWERNGFIESKSKGFLGLWSLVSAMLSGANATDPDVAISANQKAIAVWKTSSLGVDTIRSATSLIGGAWNAPVTLSTSSTDLLSHPKVAIDASGNATAIWFQASLINQTYSNVNTMSAGLAANTSAWTNFQTLTNSPGKRNPDDLVNRIAVDVYGNAFAFWSRSEDGNTYTYEGALKPIGGSFSSENPIILSNQHAYAASVTINSLGEVLAAFMVDEGSAAGIQSAGCNINGLKEVFWFDLMNISQGGSNGYPSVASALIGNTLNAGAAWIHFDGMNNVIQTSVGTKQALAPPTLLSVQQEIDASGIFTSYHNTISWVPSASPDILQYLIFKNGIFLKAVDGTATEAVESNVTENGAVTYGVVAADIEFAQSPMAIVQFP